MKKEKYELVMSKNKEGLWEDIYNVGNTIDILIDTKEKAENYIRENYADRFQNFPLHFDNEDDLYVILPAYYNLEQINPGNYKKRKT